MADTMCCQTPCATFFPTLWRTEALTHSWLAAAGHLPFSSHAFLCLKPVTRQPRGSHCTSLPCQTPPSPPEAASIAWASVSSHGVSTRLGCRDFKTTVHKSPKSSEGLKGQPAAPQLYPVASGTCHPGQYHLSSHPPFDVEKGSH